MMKMYWDFYVNVRVGMVGKAITRLWSNWVFSFFQWIPSKTHEVRILRNGWLYTHIVLSELFNGDLGLHEVIVEDDNLSTQRSFLILMVLGLNHRGEVERGEKERKLGIERPRRGRRGSERRGRESQRKAGENEWEKRWRAVSQGFTLFLCQ